MKQFCSICIMLCAILCGACSDQFETIQKYLDEGEAIYAAKMDSLKIRAGDNRVEIVGLFMYGMDTEKCLIKWFPDGDSLIIPVQRINQVETFRVFIEDMPEGTYDFEITTFDRMGNRSIVQRKSAKTYGNNYRSVLRARQVQLIELDGKKLKVTLSPEIIESINSEIIYENASGEYVKQSIPYGTTVMSISDWKSFGKYHISTHYIPELNAVDTFTVSSEEKLFPEKVKSIAMVAKSSFRELLMPGDLALSSWGAALSKAWDGILTNNNFAHSDNTHPVAFPAWFTFNMGKLAVLNRFEINHLVRTDLNYNAGNMKKWEIWGRADLPTDGSWNGWTKLMECNSYKPSGKPLGENTAADIEYIQNGEKFQFPAGLPPVQYIRIKALETWSGSGYIHFSELSFFEEVE